MKIPYYYVLMHKKKNDGGAVLGFYSTLDEAETAKQHFSSPDSNNFVPFDEMQIIETDSTLRKV
jgi:hypothetical protein